MLMKKQNKLYFSLSVCPTSTNITATNFKNYACPQGGKLSSSELEEV